MTRNASESLAVSNAESLFPEVTPEEQSEYYKNPFQCSDDDARRIYGTGHSYSPQRVTASAPGHGPGRRNQRLFA